jgi:hypothetical protein
MKLRVGDIIKIGEELYRIDLVNECRARCVPLAKRVETIRPQTGPAAGKVITISKSQAPISISPTSEVERVNKQEIAA